MSGLKTIDEALFLQMWREGKSTYAIADAVGMHRTSVTHRAKLMKLPPKRKPAKPGADLLKARKVDQAAFTAMWVGGSNMVDMQNTFGIGASAIRRRVVAWGLDLRNVGKRKLVTGGNYKSRYNSKPKPDPKPVAEPKYHPGLSDAIKRAKSSGDPVARLGKVATVYGMKYREVLEMAGVQP